MQQGGCDQWDLALGTNHDTISKTYTNREQGQDLIASEFENGTEVLGSLEVVWK